MQWVGFAELAAAVSNAGGLGIVRADLTLRTTNTELKKKSNGEWNSNS